MTPAAAPGGIAERLREPGPLVAVELRPPRLGLDAARGMSVWIDMHHAVQRLARSGTFVLLTDDAAGDEEEESLAHLAANLGGSADLGAVIPFLTCKHTVEYCRMFARRASALGVAAVAVVGGDRAVGPERCVPHGKDLRRMLRDDMPGLALGGWANPHRNPVEQARFIADEGFSADFVLTQIVSRHSLDRVERFQAELVRLGVMLPVVYGGIPVPERESADARLPGPVLPGPRPGDYRGIRSRGRGGGHMRAHDPQVEGNRRRQGVCEQFAHPERCRESGVGVGRAGGVPHALRNALDAEVSYDWLVGSLTRQVAEGGQNATPSTTLPGHGPVRSSSGRVF